MIPLKLADKVFYGSAGMFNGLVGGFVTFFVLIYYSQVLGLSAGLTGTALAVALVFDAISDPLIGRWSDQTKSKIGRRHPFMYAAIAPVAILFYYLWNPPAYVIESNSLFVHLLITIILLRMSATFFDVPSSTFVAELTNDYEERTSLVNARSVIGTITALTMILFMYGYWLADSPEYPDGILRADGYKEASLVGVLIIVVAMLSTSIGLHKKIPHLPHAPEQNSLSIKQFLIDIRNLLLEPSYSALLFAGLFGAAALGTSSALQAYLFTFFWELSSDQITILFATQIPATLLAFVMVPLLTRGREKRNIAVVTYLVSNVFLTLPIFLRLGGWFPENGSDILLPLLIGFALFDMSLYVCGTVIWSSMLADVVELRQVSTGRREEGLLFSLQTFVGKLTGAVGTIMAGLVLEYAAFPKQAIDSIRVPADALDRFGWAYAPLVLVLYTIAAYAISRYKIDRNGHEMRVRELQLATNTHLETGFKKMENLS